MSFFFKKLLKLSSNVLFIGGAGLEYPYHVLPLGYWWFLLYASIILLLCLVVCLVGAHIYAKATFLIFIIVMSVLSSVFVSFFIVGPRVVVLPVVSGNSTQPATANFTGLKMDTLLGNLWGKFELQLAMKLTCVIYRQKTARSFICAFTWF